MIFVRGLNFSYYLSKIHHFHEPLYYDARSNSLSIPLEDAAKAIRVSYSTIRKWVGNPPIFNGSQL